MATSGDRAGPEHSSPGSTTPVPASDPQAGSPSCRAGLASLGCVASSSPSPRPPNHWDPGLAKGSGSSCRSGGAAMAGGAPDRATESWQGRDAVARGAGALCCCPYRDSGLREAAESPRRRRCLCCNSGGPWLLLWALRLLLLPLLFLRGPGAAARLRSSPAPEAACCASAASLLPSLLLRR